MTDWQYPPAPATAFETINGTSIFDWHTAVISQYANSPRLLQLISDFAGYVDPTATFDAFYNDVMNLDTAQGYGLDVWGRIVGVNRVLQVPTQRFFGFAQDALPFGDAQFQGWTPYFGFAKDASGFGQAPFGSQKIFAGVNPAAGGGIFYSGGALTSNYALSDQAYRQLIYAKAESNICSGAIPAINRILLNLFPGRGNCYVQEDVLPQYFGFAKDALPFGQGPFYGGQQIQRYGIAYVFHFALSNVEQAIVAQSGVLPKPPGIPATVIVLSS